MLSEYEADLSETQTHKLADTTSEAPKEGPSGALSAPPTQWEALRPGCEFHLLRYAQTPLFQAPLTTPRAILDLGCGGGRWAATCQQHFAEATVTGVDCKVPHSTTPQIALGFQFRQADILVPLPFATGTFDYVHIRFMAMAIPIARWLPVLRECLRVLKPQGWLEIQELGLPRISHPGPWIGLVLLGRANGVEVFPGTALGKWLHHVGGSNIGTSEHTLQRNADPNASARMMIRDGIALFELCREALIAQRIMSDSTYEHELRHMQYNLFVPNRQDTLPIHTAICQKG